MPKGNFLHSVLIGKAREIYSALPVDVSTQYEEVQQAILKAYELVPEVYHQKFGNCKKQELFDHWCSASQVNNDYHKLR